MEAKLEFLTNERVSIYIQRLIHVAGDKLAFDLEYLNFDTNDGDDKSITIFQGRFETRIIELAHRGDPTQS